MPMIVANNLNALATQNALNSNNAKMSGSLERLSTGYKINSGKDDPSGLVISEQLRAQNVGLERAIQNTQEANNVLGIAEGALNEMNNILKKMRQLAIHSANNGVTSPEQVAADQAEVDSSIQTIDRIARTTKFSDQFLLNGNKELQYDSSVLITDTHDMKLVNESLSDIRQIFKRDDFKLNINFSGATTNAAGDTISNNNEATKGYFEISKTESAATQLVTGSSDKTLNYTLTSDQAFTLSGNDGSRYLSFAKGTHLGEMVTSINSVSDSTGVEATLIYDSNATTATDVNGTQDLNTSAHVAGQADVFNRTELGEITTAGATSVSVTSVNNFEEGVNIDGYGRAYLKMIDDDTFEIFKDSAMTMKVAEGDVDASGDTQIMAVNNSNFTGIDLTFSSDVGAGMTSVIQLGYMQTDAADVTATVTTETLDFSDLALASSTAGSASAGNTHFENSGSYLSGIKLGENTDETGKLYVKANLYDDTGGSSDQSQIFIYKDARMRDEDLVAMSDKVDLTTDSNGIGMRIYAAAAGGNGADSGLYGTLNFDMSDAEQDLSFETVISAENLGVRISADEYGSNEFVKVDQHEGAIFSRYSEVDGAVLLDAGLDGEDWTEYGRDATVSLNGQELTLEGIEGTITNLDTTAKIAFNEGGLGTTTIAAVGYDEGSFGSRVKRMYETADNYVNHAIHSTTESLGDWEGGMQFQLGEGAGDQERTVLSIKDMTATSLGRVRFTGSFETALDSEKTLSINDMLSGGWASLGKDPVKALEIIDQAIEDVSELRANIGAFQTNMLETNANSLSVAVENITKTESYIRDADMAKESTDFSKNQIMVQAGTSMLAQANQLSQGVMSLLG